MPYQAEKVRPYNDHEQKHLQVERMFDDIADTYDRLNHTLSFYLDKAWRKKVITYLRPYAPQHILDIATGTGDLVLALCASLHPQTIIASDLSKAMLHLARAKATDAGYAEKILFERQDCLSLTYADSTFDAVTLAFGIRNFENIEKGLEEIHRVLKPGGQLAILELSTPQHFPVKQLYNLYSKTAIPLLGRLISKNKTAYQYLPASIRAVPQGHTMTDLLTRKNFKTPKSHPLTFGICTLYTATR